MKIPNHQHQWISTCAAAAICAYLLYLTHGASGIGWFILALMFIW